MDPNEHNSGESEEEDVAPQVSIIIELLIIKNQDSIEDIKSTQSQLADQIDKVDVNADENENEEEIEDENEIENENEAEEGENSPQNADVTQVKAPQGKSFDQYLE